MIWPPAAGSTIDRWIGMLAQVSQGRVVPVAAPSRRASSQSMSLQNPSFWPGAKLLDLPRKRSPGDTELIPYVMYIIQLGILKLWEGLGIPAATGARSTFRARLVLPSLACSPAAPAGASAASVASPKRPPSALPVLRPYLCPSASSVRCLPSLLCGGKNQQAAAAERGTVTIIVPARHVR